MATATLRPASTDLNTGAVTGAASAHAAFADDSDSSYVTFDGPTPMPPGEQWSGGLTDLSLPSGALIKTVFSRARVANSGTSLNMVINVLPGTGALLADAYAGITWSTPATFIAGQTSRTGISDSDMDGAKLYIANVLPTGTALRVYEAFVDVVYVEQPEVTASAPTGTVTDTNLPTVVWSNDLDADGGVQTYYQVRVFTDAVYGGGGFDPDTSSAAVGTGLLTGTDLSWTVSSILPDDTYRAYVRVAQTVNGEQHWSDWDYTEFEIDVALPAPPTIMLTADDDNARIQIDISDASGSGDATTDYFEIARSIDSGTTWDTVRQITAGLLIPTGGSFTVYDYEASNSVAVSYRARALHDYSGALAASDWASDDATWESDSWWLKHPNRPDLNVPVTIRSFPEVTRSGRQGVFQPLGSSRVVVVQDTRAPKSGTVTLRSDSFEEQDALDALLDEHATLLLQGPPGSGDPGYIRVTNHSRQRVIDWEDASLVFEALEFACVDSPSGDVVAWP